MVKTSATTCAGGINQNLEAIQRNQVADALNVWVPNEVIEQRPGYVGICAPGYIDSKSVFAIESMGEAVFHGEDFSTTPPTWSTATPGQLFPLGGFPVKSRWYFGFPSLLMLSGTAIGAFLFQLSAPNTNTNISFYAQYWNGTNWAHLIVQERDYFQGSLFEAHLNTPNFYPSSIFSFVPPADWAQVLIQGFLCYYLRFILQGPEEEALSVGTCLDNGGVGNGPWCLHYSGQTRGLLKASSATAKETLFTGFIPNLNQIDFYAFDSLALSNFVSLDLFDVLDVACPFTSAVLPLYNEFFLTGGGRTSRFPIPVDEQSKDSIQFNALVENRDFAVGPGANWDPATVSLRSSWPEADFITYALQRLWVAKGSEISWSAGSPFHKVWPAAHTEVCLEDDPTDITAITLFGSNIIVFKHRSIWEMVYHTVDNFGQTFFIPRKIMSGIGCVAPNSIRVIRGEIIFLAESGLYRYNGIRAEKVSVGSSRFEGPKDIDRLVSFWSRITPGARAFASAADWSTQGYYLLSLACDGSNENNVTLAWDYENNTFWIWEGIPAQCWLEDRDDADKLRLYFGDYQGRIYEFGIGDHDHGAAIHSHVLTRPLGYKDGLQKQLVRVAVISKNENQAIGIETLIDGRRSLGAQTLNFWDYNEQKIEGAILGSARFADVVRREKRVGLNAPCHYIQIKVSASTRGSPLFIGQILADFAPLGRRP